ncbi:DoxX family protein [Spirosoma sp. KCTC 42546]|uniref:DoxX family protein n=1 Tax=Spirosoma sp. KCTC 42546 TaxID=2520506 RepID=UPI001FEE0986|nr:DoxX family protein [Spirosoma sp. KCTC 42546]
MAVLDVPRSRSDAKAVSQVADWQPYEKTLFRFVFLYFAVQLLPLDGQFVRNLVATEGGYSRYVFNLSRYAPHFFGPQDSFLNWLVVALVALVGTIVWSLRANPSTNYDSLYYWLRVALRYRLAIGLIAYGFIKLFPLQAPLPSISNLNTAYGDHSAWKLFSLTLGIVPSYQSFLGGVELLGGLLLLHRKTATIGTLIILPFLGNVFFSNLAYEGGEYVYSGLLITFALVLFAFDAIRLFRLLSLELPTTPNRFQPIFSEQWQRYGRWTFKVAFVFFAVVLYGYSTYAAYRKGSVRFPQTPGLPGVAGLYNVSEFRIGGKTLPYSKTDPTRWQDVVFEAWNTISIKSNQPVRLVTTNVEQLAGADSERDYELAGSQGRHYYRYTIDSTNRLLTLKNANPNEAAETLKLAYTQVGNGQIILSGVAAPGVAGTQDSVYAVLDKVNKKYLIDEAAKAGRRGALKL